MRGDSSVAGEGRVACLPKFHSWGKYTMPLKIISSDWMSNASLACVLFIFIILFISSKVTGPQDAHGRLVLQVYLSSNTSESSAIRR